MPFESKAQQRFMFAAESRGELPKGTAKRWAKHTPDIKALPEKKPVEETKKSAAVLAIVRRLYKQADDPLGAPKPVAKPSPFSESAIGPTDPAVLRRNSLPKPGIMVPKPAPMAMPQPLQAKAANDGTTSPAAPMQQLSAGQPAQPPGPRRADQIASEIAAIHPEHRSTAAYHRIRAQLPGSVRGFAAASQPTAKENFTAALGKKAEEDPLIFGLIRGCADAGLSENGMLALLRKTAERQDTIGARVRGFLDCVDGL